VLSRTRPFSTSVAPCAFNNVCRPPPATCSGLPGASSRDWGWRLSAILGRKSQAGLDPSNAGPEWQARIYCYRSRHDGSLSTPGACSKVSHLHRLRLQTFTAQESSRHLSLASHAGAQLQSKGQDDLQNAVKARAALQIELCKGSPWKAPNLWPPWSTPGPLRCRPGPWQ